MFDIVPVSCNEMLCSSIFAHDAWVALLFALQNACIVLEELLSEDDEVVQVLKSFTLTEHSRLNYMYYANVLNYMYLFNFV